MIKAENLEYDTVIKAMEDGHIYASTGPIIKNIYTENGKVFIETEPCAAIVLRSQNRLHKTVRSLTDSITEASFDILDEYQFIRFEVLDTKRNKAMTRAFTKEMF